MFKLLSIVTVAALFLTVILYATWLFTQRLRTGQPKIKSFVQWVRDMLDALWGLG